MEIQSMKYSVFGLQRKEQYQLPQNHPDRKKKQIKQKQKKNIFGVSGTLSNLKTK